MGEATGSVSRTRPAAPRTPAGWGFTTWSGDREERAHRATARLATHVVDVAQSILDSCDRGSAVVVELDGRAAGCPARRRCSPCRGRDTAVTSLPGRDDRTGGCWRVTADGSSFRDLNGNGELDPYEDPRLPIEDRVDDLLARMTLEEKAAQLFHQGLVVPDDGALGDAPDAIAQVSARGLVEPRPDALQHLLGARATSAGRVAQPDAGGGGGNPARDSDHHLLRPAPRSREQPGDEHGRQRILEVARPDRARRNA